MAVSKRIRFEVFKRDGFACQYCGRTPPAVMLECDHVVASANGGSDDDSNLVTSCFDCNRGKSDIPLEVIVPTTAERLARERELADQKDAYDEFVMERKNRLDQDIQEVGLGWFNRFKRKKNVWEFGPSRVGSVRNFLRRLPKAEVLEAIDIAHANAPPVGTKAGDDNCTFRYFCGVCWRMIREREGDEE